MTIVRNIFVLAVDKASFDPTQIRQRSRCTDSPGTVVAPIAGVTRPLPIDRMNVRANRVASQVDGFFAERDALPPGANDQQGNRHRVRRPGATLPERRAPDRLIPVAW